MSVQLLGDWSRQRKPVAFDQLLQLSIQDIRKELAQSEFRSDGDFRALIARVLVIQLLEQEQICGKWLAWQQIYRRPASQSQPSHPALPPDLFDRLAQLVPGLHCLSPSDIRFWELLINFIRPKTFGQPGPFKSACARATALMFGAQAAEIEAAADLSTEQLWNAAQKCGTGSVFQRQAILGDLQRLHSRLAGMYYKFDFFATLKSSLQDKISLNSNGRPPLKHVIAALDFVHKQEVQQGFEPELGWPAHQDPSQVMTRWHALTAKLGQIEVPPPDKLLADAAKAEFEHLSPPILQLPASAAVIDSHCCQGDVSFITVGIDISRHFVVNGHRLAVSDAPQPDVLHLLARYGRIQLKQHGSPLNNAVFVRLNQESWTSGGGLTSVTSTNAAVVPLNFSRRVLQSSPAILLLGVFVNDRSALDQAHAMMRSFIVDELASARHEPFQEGPEIMAAALNFCSTAQPSEQQINAMKHALGKLSRSTLELSFLSGLAVLHADELVQRTANPLNNRLSEGAQLIVRSMISCPTTIPGSDPPISLQPIRQNILLVVPAITEQIRQGLEAAGFSCEPTFVDSGTAETTISMLQDMPPTSLSFHFYTLRGSIAPADFYRMMTVMASKPLARFFLVDGDLLSMLLRSSAGISSLIHSTHDVGSRSSAYLPYDGALQFPQSLLHLSEPLPRLPADARPGGHWPRFADGRNPGATFLITSDPTLLLWRLQHDDHGAQSDRPVLDPLQTNFDEKWLELLQPQLDQRKPRPVVFQRGHLLSREKKLRIQAVACRNEASVLFVQPQLSDADLQLRTVDGNVVVCEPFHLLVEQYLLSTASGDDCRTTLHFYRCLRLVFGSRFNVDRFSLLGRAACGPSAAQIADFAAAMTPSTFVHCLPTTQRFVAAVAGALFSTTPSQARNTGDTLLLLADLLTGHVQTSLSLDDDVPFDTFCAATPALHLADQQSRLYCWLACFVSPALAASVAQQCHNNLTVYIPLLAFHPTPERVTHARYPASQFSISLQDYLLLQAAAYEEPPWNDIQASPHYPFSLEYLTKLLELSPFPLRLVLASHPAQLFRILNSIPPGVQLPFLVKLAALASDPHVLQQLSREAAASSSAAASSHSGVHLSVLRWFFVRQNVDVPASLRFAARDLELLVALGVDLTGCTACWPQLADLLLQLELKADARRHDFDENPLFKLQEVQRLIFSPLVTLPDRVLSRLSFGSLFIDFLLNPSMIYQVIDVQRQAASLCAHPLLVGLVHIAQHRDATAQSSAEAQLAQFARSLGHRPDDNDGSTTACDFLLQSPFFNSLPKLTDDAFALLVRRASSVGQAVLLAGLLAMCDLRFTGFAGRVLSIMQKVPPASFFALELVDSLLVARPSLRAAFRGAAGLVHSHLQLVAQVLQPTGDLVQLVANAAQLFERSCLVRDWVLSRGLQPAYATALLKHMSSTGLHQLTEELHRRLLNATNNNEGNDDDVDSDSTALAQLFFRLWRRSPLSDIGPLIFGAGKKRQRQVFLRSTVDADEYDALARFVLAHPAASDSLALFLVEPFRLSFSQQQCFADHFNDALQLDGNDALPAELREQIFTRLPQLRIALTPFLFLGSNNKFSDPLPLFYVYYSPVPAAYLDHYVGELRRQNMLRTEAQSIAYHHENPTPLNLAFLRVFVVDVISAVSFGFSKDTLTTALHALHRIWYLLGELRVEVGLRDLANIVGLQIVMRAWFACAGVSDEKLAEWLATDDIRRYDLLSHGQAVFNLADIQPSLFDAQQDLVRIFNFPYSFSLQLKEDLPVRLFGPKPEDTRFTQGRLQHLFSQSRPNQAPSFPLAQHLSYATELGRDLAVAVQRILAEQSVQQQFRPPIVPEQDLEKKTTLSNRFFPCLDEDQATQITNINCNMSELVRISTPLIELLLTETAAHLADLLIRFTQELLRAFRLHANWAPNNVNGCAVLHYFFSVMIGSNSRMAWFFEQILLDFSPSGGYEISQTLDSYTYVFENPYPFFNGCLPGCDCRRVVINQEDVNTQEFAGMVFTTCGGCGHLPSEHRAVIPTMSLITVSANHGFQADNMPRLSCQSIAAYIPAGRAATVTTADQHQPAAAAQARTDQPAELFTLQPQLGQRPPVFTLRGDQFVSSGQLPFQCVDLSAIFHVFVTHNRVDVRLASGGSVELWALTDTCAAVRPATLGSDCRKIQFPSFLYCWHRLAMTNKIQLVIGSLLLQRKRSGEFDMYYSCWDPTTAAGSESYSSPPFWQLLGNDMSKSLLGRVPSVRTYLSRVYAAAAILPEDQRTAQFQLFEQFCRNELSPGSESPPVFSPVFLNRLRQAFGSSYADEFGNLMRNPSALVMLRQIIGRCIAHPLFAKNKPTNAAMEQIRTQYLPTVDRIDNCNRLDNNGATRDIKDAKLNLLFEHKHRNQSAVVFIDASFYNLSSNIVTGLPIAMICADLLLTPEFETGFIGVPGAAQQQQAAPSLQFVDDDDDDDEDDDDEEDSGDNNPLLAMPFAGNEEDEGQSVSSDETATPDGFEKVGTVVTWLVSLFLSPLSTEMQHYVWQLFAFPRGKYACPMSPTLRDRYILYALSQTLGEVAFAKSLALLLRGCASLPAHLEALFKRAGGHYGIRLIDPLDIPLVRQWCEELRCGDSVSSPRVGLLETVQNSSETDQHHWLQLLALTGNSDVVCVVGRSDASDRFMKWCAELSARQPWLFFFFEGVFPHGFLPENQDRMNYTQHSDDWMVERSQRVAYPPALQTDLVAQLTAAPPPAIAAAPPQREPKWTTKLLNHLREQIGAQTHEHRHVVVVSLAGPPGVGKSRFILKTFPGKLRRLVGGWRFRFDYEDGSSAHLTRSSVRDIFFQKGIGNDSDSIQVLIVDEFHMMTIGQKTDVVQLAIEKKLVLVVVANRLDSSDRGLFPPGHKVFHARGDHAKLQADMARARVPLDEPQAGRRIYLHTLNTVLRSLFGEKMLNYRFYHKLRDIYLEHGWRGLDSRPCLEALQRALKVVQPHLTFTFCAHLIEKLVAIIRRREQQHRQLVNGDNDNSNVDVVCRHELAGTDVEELQYPVDSLIHFALLDELLDMPSYPDFVLSLDNATAIHPAVKILLFYRQLATLHCQRRAVVEPFRFTAQQVNTLLKGLLTYPLLDVPLRFPSIDVDSRTPAVQHVDALSTGLLMTARVNFYDLDEVLATFNQGYCINHDEARAAYKERFVTDVKGVKKLVSLNAQFFTLLCPENVAALLVDDNDWTDDIETSLAALIVKHFAACQQPPAPSHDYYLVYLDALWRTYLRRCHDYASAPAEQQQRWQAEPWTLLESTSIQLFRAMLQRASKTHSRIVLKPGGRVADDYVGFFAATLRRHLSIVSEQQSGAVLSSLWNGLFAPFLSADAVPQLLNWRAAYQLARVTYPPHPSWSTDSGVACLSFLLHSTKHSVLRQLDRDDFWQLVVEQPALLEVIVSNADFACDVAWQTRVLTSTVNFDYRAPCVHIRSPLTVADVRNRFELGVRACIGRRQVITLDPHLPLGHEIISLAIDLSPDYGRLLTDPPAVDTIHLTDANVDVNAAQQLSTTSPDQAFFSQLSELVVPVDLAVYQENIEPANELVFGCAANQNINVTPLDHLAPAAEPNPFRRSTDHVVASSSENCDNLRQSNDALRRSIDNAGPFDHHNALRRSTEHAGSIDNRASLRRSAERLRDSTDGSQCFSSRDALGRSQGEARDEVRRTAGSDQTVGVPLLVARRAVGPVRRRPTNVRNRAVPAHDTSVSVAPARVAPPPRGPSYLPHGIDLLAQRNLLRPRK